MSSIIGLLVFIADRWFLFCHYFRLHLNSYSLAAVVGMPFCENGKWFISKTVPELFESKLVCLERPREDWLKSWLYKEAQWSEKYELCIYSPLAAKFGCIRKRGSKSPCRVYFIKVVCPKFEKSTFYCWLLGKVELSSRLIYIVT